MSSKTVTMDPLLLYLSSRVLTTLHKNNLHRLNSVAKRTRSELMELSQVGHQSANEIIGLLMDLSIPAGTSLPEQSFYTEPTARLISGLTGTETKLWKTQGVDLFRRGSLVSGSVESNGLDCTIEIDAHEIMVSVTTENGQINCSCGAENCVNHALAGTLLVADRRRRRQLPDEYAPAGVSPFQPLTHDPLFWMLKPATRESILEQGILWVEELSSLSTSRIKEIPGIGRSRFTEIKNLLEEVNLKPGTAPETARERPAQRFPPDFGYALKELRRSVSRRRSGEKLFRNHAVSPVEQNSGSQFTGRVGTDDTRTVSLNWHTRTYDCFCSDRTSRKHCRHQLAVALEAAKHTRIRILSGMHTEDVSDELAWLMTSLDGRETSADWSGEIKTESDATEPIRYYLYRTDDAWTVYPSNCAPDAMPEQPPEKMNESPAYDDLSMSLQQKDRAILNVLSARVEDKTSNEHSTDWGDLLPLLAERPLYIQDQAGNFTDAIVDENRGRACVKIRSMDEGGYRMHPFVELDDQRLAGTQIELISIQPLWIRSAEHLYPVAAPPVYADLLQHRSGEGIPIPEGDESSFAKQVLPKLMDHGIRVGLPKDISVKRDLKLTKKVYLSETNDDLIVRPRFDYGEIEFGRVTDGSFLLPEPDGDTFIPARRNIKQERDFLEYLRQTGLRTITDGSKLKMTPETGRARWLIDERPRLEENGIEVITQGSLEPSPEVFEPAGSRLSIESGIDWFELDGQIEYETRTAELQELFEAIQNDQKYVRLSDSTYGKIPDKMSSQLSGIQDLVRSGTSNVQLPGLSTQTIDGLLDSIDDTKTDETFENYRRFYEDFDGITEVRETSAFRGTLRPYQRAGLAWMQFLRKYGFGGLLADDMGLGKTVQVLAQLQLVEEQQEEFPDTLVICPRSVLKNWQREAEHFLSEPNLHEHHGPTRIEDVREWPEEHLSLTTYGTMRSDVDMLKNCEFDTIVLDECQAIRNPDTKTAQAVQLLNAKHRIGLSGTPVQNTAMDLWAQFQFLNPGLLGDRSYFDRTFVRPIEEQRDEEASDRLQQLIHPFLLRRTKDTVEKQLPELSRSILDCPLFPEQNELYESYRKKFRQQISDTIREKGVQQSHFKVLEGLTRLRQICCHPALVDEDYDDETSNKLARFIEQTTELIEEGHRVLVFSQFVQFLKRIRSVIDAKGWSYEYLDGQTRNREERVQRFQSNESIPLFLISLKAGGEGLNLTGADYVFLMDPWWNPAVEQQAMDRTHRIGQDQPVFVYRFICPDTIEEKMLSLQERKKEMAGDVVTPESGVFKDMDRHELLDLFS